MAKNFESDVTRFLKEFKQRHPETEQAQREGRARLWDKTLDAELQEGYKQSRIPQKPYVYQTN
jgi:Protein of unknown function (DUF3460).